MDLFKILCCCFLIIIKIVNCIPVALLYDHNTKEAINLPRDNDVSSPEIKLKVPIIFFGVPFNTIFVNSNGLLSFQTEIPVFFNTEFPLDYPVIAPFYSNIDLRRAGTVTYYESNSSSLLQRASNDIRDSFSNQNDFQATSLFIVTWFGVGYYNKGSDKINTFQVVIATDGRKSFAEFLYPENGIQWIQGTGDESGLPDARAQAGFFSADAKIFSLPGSGTEQVRNLEGWSNIDLNGQFIYRIDSSEIIEPDLNNNGNKLRGPPVSCVQAPTYCHTHSRCIDYDEGFCCKCKDQYYGNGKFCVKKDVPLRVNGKVSGRINGERFENLDLQSYIVMVDGRAYTAISKIPTSINFDIQSLQILGGVIGYLFAKPLRDSLNGYQLTGGVFNHTAIIRFLNTTQTISIKQKYLGLDVFDQIRLDCDIQGEIPNLPDNAKIVVDDYHEQYTLTSPGVIQMTSTRTFKHDTTIYYYTIDQTFLFDYCKFVNVSIGETWKLKVANNFIGYESREQIVRFGLTNKITPIGDVDPCELGRTQCGSNSACVVENDSFRCVCNPGFQHIYSGSTIVCADINECQTGINECDYNAHCTNEIGGYTCTCNPGFEGNGHVCTNTKTCRNTRCGENAECVETTQGATCRCLPNYTGDGQYCNLNDSNCNVRNICSPNGYCNLDRENNKYYCSCLSGYQGDGYSCEKEEYENFTSGCNVINNCSQNGSCLFDNETNSYSCFCLPGFEGNGYNCRQLFENATEAAPKVIQRCLFTVCWCPEGYKIEQGTTYCIPNEEIVEEQTETLDQLFNGGDNGELHPEVNCYNSTICFCPRGYNYIKSTNSCLIKNDTNWETKGFSGIDYSCNVLNNCNKNAQCIYSYESENYSCICNQGYEGNGFECKPEIISCTKVNNCDPHATCTYDGALGKSKCVCNQGYEGDGITCRITAICRSNEDCTKTEECLHTNLQRYECVCKDGHTRDSQNQCIPITGSCGGGTCVDNAECLYDDEYETNYCTCKSGYIGDGITECKLKPVGCNVLNNCGLHATCDYDQFTSLYQCKCDSGFYGDGFVCYTEINCHVDPNLCHPQASCVTDANRRYICKCNTGYIGNGTFCKSNPKYEGNFLLLNQGMATLRIPFEPNKRNLGKPIQIKYEQTAVGLDVDCLEGRVYWSDINGKAIRSSNYFGTEKLDFITEGIGSPEGLSIDWASRNIYWTDSTKDTIEVASIENKLRRILFDTDLVNPRGIVVHPQRGKIFWTDWDRKKPKIEWANADGTGREIFLQGEAVSLPNSLTIDFGTEQLCYADAGTKKIECVDIDSKRKHTIAINCTYPFGITVTDQYIYWSDWISKKIEQVEKYNLIRLPPLSVPLGGSGNKLFGLVAVPNSCPPLTNVCQYYKDQCPPDHICLPNGLGSRSCVSAFK